MPDCSSDSWLTVRPIKALQQSYHAVADSSPFRQELPIKVKTNLGTPKEQSSFAAWIRNGLG